MSVWFLRNCGANVRLVALRSSIYRYIYMYTYIYVYIYLYIYIFLYIYIYIYMVNFFFLATAFTVKTCNFFLTDPKWAILGVIRLGSARNNRIRSIWALSERLSDFGLLGWPV